MKLSRNKYVELLDNIGSTLQRARESAVKAVNNELVKANWEIGQYIVEYEQHGKEKAEYGSALLSNLAKDLKSSMGKALARVAFIFAGSFTLNTQNSRQCLEN